MVCHRYHHSSFIFCIANNVVSSLADNQIIAGNADAIPMILNMMYKFIDSPSVCYNGCGALRNITGVTINQKIAGECKGIDVIINVLARYAQDKNICYRCCSALWNITVYPPNQKLITTGVVDIVVYALYVHSGAPETVEKIIGALKSFKWNTDSNGVIIYNALIRDPNLSKFMAMIFSERELQSYGYRQNHMFH